MLNVVWLLSSIIHKVKTACPQLAPAASMTLKAFLMLVACMDLCCSVVSVSGCPWCVMSRDATYRSRAAAAATGSWCGSVDWENWTERPRHLRSFACRNWTASEICPDSRCPSRSRWFAWCSVGRASRRSDRASSRPLQPPCRGWIASAACLKRSCLLLLEKCATFFIVLDQATKCALVVTEAAHHEEKLNANSNAIQTTYVRNGFQSSSQCGIHRRWWPELCCWERRWCPPANSSGPCDTACSCNPTPWAGQGTKRSGTKTPTPGCRHGCKLGRCWPSAPCRRRNWGWRGLPPFVQALPTLEAGMTFPWHKHCHCSSRGSRNSRRLGPPPG